MWRIKSTGCSFLCTKFPAACYVSRLAFSVSVSVRVQRVPVHTPAALAGLIAAPDIGSSHSETLFDSTATLEYSILLNYGLRYGAIANTAHLSKANSQKQTSSRLSKPHETCRHLAWSNSARRQGAPTTSPAATSDLWKYTWIGPSR